MQVKSGIFSRTFIKRRGGGEIRAAVPGVEQDGQAPAVGFLIDGEHALVVDVEPLEIRVELDAPQPPALDVVHLSLDVGHVLMPCGQADELGVLLALFLDELVDGAHLLHFGGHGAHQEPVDAGLLSPLG